MPEIHIDAVVYREGNLFIAHALQLDLVVTAPTEREAMQDLADVCQAQIVTAFENKNFDNLFRPAPPEIWKMFSDAQAARTYTPPQEVPRKWRTSPVSLSAALAVPA